MKSITRVASVLAVSLALVLPAVSFADTTVVSSPNGFLFSNNNFTFATGNGGGLMGGGQFACGASNICQVASTILYIINYVLVPLLFAIAFIVFLYGIVLKYILSHGDPEKVSEGHRLLLWGLIGFVVMISLWGLVNVVANTFGLYGISAPPPPRSY